MDQFKNKPVFLMPFSPKSIFIYYLLKEEEANILGFCDNNRELSLKEFDGTSIYTPEEAYKIEPDAVIILSEIRYSIANREQMANIGFKNIIMFHELSFDVDLSKIIPKLNSDNYCELIPRQMHAARLFLKELPTINSWNEYVTEEIEMFKFPYSFHENENISVPLHTNSLKFLICINSTELFNKDYFAECLESLKKQDCRFTAAIISLSENVNEINNELNKAQIENAIHLSAKAGMENIDTVKFVHEHYEHSNEYDFIITIGGNDKFSKDILAVFNNEMQENKSFIAYTANEDRIYHNEYISPYYKRDYQLHKLADTKCLMRQLLCVRTEFQGNIRDINPDDVYVIDKILYHYRILDKAICDNKVKPIAFYLPQFHAIPENDKWWGKGFTEWKNVKRAFPMYEGHYQPRIPGELGYYNLVEDKDIQKKQMDLAQKHGVYGFCYYYYWFSGKRLLEKPLDNVLNNPNLDMPFCICWANESWSRRWDGKEGEILMKQEYSDENDSRFIKDILPILRDPRYITVHGAPILLIYLYDLFPDFKETVKRWRKIAAQEGVEEIHISIVKTAWYPQRYVKEFGCDSETEFHPWRVMRANLRITNGLTVVNSNFDGRVFDYKDYIYRCMNYSRKQHLTFRGLMLGFDNTPRRMESATVYHGSTPEEYKKLMLSLVDYTSREHSEERLIFINAWNEWAESNYLEPDERYGDGYLKATSDALKINC